MFWNTLFALHVNLRFFIWTVPALLWFTSESKMSMTNSLRFLFVTMWLFNVVSIPPKLVKTNWPVMTFQIDDIPKECESPEFRFLSASGKFDLWYSEIEKGYALLKLLSPVSVDYYEGGFRKNCSAFLWEDTLENCACGCKKINAVILKKKEKSKVSVEDAKKHLLEKYKGFSVFWEDRDILLLVDSRFLKDLKEIFESNKKCVDILGNL